MVLESENSYTVTVIEIGRRLSADEFLDASNWTEAWGEPVMFAAFYLVMLAAAIVATWWLWRSRGHIAARHLYIAAGLGIVAALLYPPWYKVKPWGEQKRHEYFGYAWVFDPPYGEVYLAYGPLALQVGALAAAAGIAHILLRR